VADNRFENAASSPLQDHRQQVHQDSRDEVGQVEPDAAGEQVEALGGDEGTNRGK